MTSELRIHCAHPALSGQARCFVCSRLVPASFVSREQAVASFTVEFSRECSPVEHSHKVSCYRSRQRTVSSQYNKVDASSDCTTIV
jgi:hypothetical protein